MSVDITLIWAGVIAFSVIMYVLLDGFDLGLGILFPFMRDERERDVAMNSVAPIWDFNETWLILGGTGIFGAGTYYMLKLIAAGPKTISGHDAPTPRPDRRDKRPKRPLSVLDESPNPNESAEPAR